LSLLVIVASLYFLLCSFCAISGKEIDGGMNVSERLESAAWAFAAGCIAAGGIWGIAKLSRKK